MTRVEVAPLLGEAVLEARRAILVAHALEDAVRDELPQPIGQAVARDAEIALEVLEAADAEERVAQDEQRPAVADDGQRPRHRAGEVSDVTPAHGANIGFQFRTESRESLLSLDMPTGHLPLLRRGPCARAVPDGPS